MIPPHLRPCTILLVDDEAANLDLLEEILRAEGYTSLPRVQDARLAARALDVYTPDLVLLDLHMPHRDGFQVLQDIRSRTAVGEFLPVLVLTADVAPEARERALSSGAHDFLTKPFNAVEVGLRTRNLLEIRLLQRLERRARLQAEAARSRATLLAEVSRALGASLDCSTSLAALARLLTPRLADGCVLLLHDGERWAEVGLAHVNPRMQPVLRTETQQGDGAARVAAVLQGERAGVVPTLPGGGAVGAGGPGSALAAPIRVQGQSAAGLVLVRSAPRPGFEPDDLVLVEEIAARAALTVENARLFAEAQRATRARDRILSVVAHELRNPLAVVTLYAEGLLDTLPPEQGTNPQEALKSIFQSAQRMQSLIEDLLDASRMQQAALSLQRARQPLAPLLREAQRMLRPLVGSRPVALIFDPESPDGAMADAVAEVDGGRLLQVLSNLVGNALKFTPDHGRILVSWKVTAGQLRATVADTGPGIPPEQLPHVFGAFWQATDTDRRGVGLGLWIARAVVEAHGGRIWVDSREGGGAAFHFTLPLRATGSGHGVAQPPPAPLLPPT